MSSEELGVVIEPKNETSGGKFYKALYDLLGPDSKDGSLRLDFGQEGGVVFTRVGNRVSCQIVDAQNEMVIAVEPQEYKGELVVWDEGTATRNLPVALALDVEPFDGYFGMIEVPSFGQVVEAFRNAEMKFVRLDLTEGTLILDQGKTGIMLIGRRQVKGGDWTVNFSLDWNGQAVAETT